VLDRRPDAERLDRLRNRAGLRRVRGAAPVDPLVYARDVEYILGALAAETTYADQMRRRAESRKQEAESARAQRDEALARLGEAEELGRSEGKAERG
jgi:hypothetical protein